MESCPNEKQEDKEVEKTEEEIFFEAVWANESEVVSTMIQNGFDLFKKDIKGYTPLQKCTIAGNFEAVVQILEKIKDIDYINYQDWCGFSSLQFSANEGFVDIAEQLLIRGASVDLKNEDSVCYLSKIPLYECGGKTALHLAAEKGEIDCVKLLLKYGSDPNLEDFDGNTPYQLSLLKKYEECSKILRKNESYPIKISKAERESQKINDFKKRSKRINEKEKEKTKLNKNMIILNYKPLYPEIFELTEDHFEASFLSAIKVSISPLKPNPMYNR